MNDSLTKLLEYLEPKIIDIHENRAELKSLSYVYKTIEEIVDLGKKSYFEILDYYDQDFIIKAIKISNHDVDNRVEKYKITRYLLKNQDSSVKELPQYKESIIYMESLFIYLCDLYQDIKLELEKKEQKLKIQELLNKYYLLLKKNNIFITDAEEFITFLDLCNVSVNDKLNILIFINKCNIKNYTTTNDIIITNGIRLSNITSLLEKDINLLDNSFLSLDNIELDEKELNEENLFKKKKYLYNQINLLYDEKRYDEIIDYYLEYNMILIYENEFNKQKNKFNDNVSKKLVFVMDNNKSLVRKYLDNCIPEYKSCVYKNLLDIETEKELMLPDYSYNKINFYIKDEFIIKTVYTYLDNGYVLVLGVLDKDLKIEQFLNENKSLFSELNNIIKDKKFDLNERDLILDNIKIEDLVLTIDLNTLDIKNGGEYAR